MEYFVGILHAFVSPVNCVAHLGSAVLSHVTGDLASFAQCVGSNLTSAGQAVTNVPL